MAVSRSMRLIDIGANLTDQMYQGVYHGKSYHPPDLHDVLKRSHDIGVDKIIVTGGSLSDCANALDLAKQYDYLYSTVGVHPTRCNEFEGGTDGMTTQQYLDKLRLLAIHNKGKVVAIGECGLDYDRLHFCEKSIQLKYFELQLSLADETCLPLFLHCRNAFSDFIDIVKRHRNMIHNSGGVVHSFDGSISQMKSIIECGMFIGINGCSLKTSANLSVIGEIPIDRLLIETDSPWCEIRSTHASYPYVKTRFDCKKKERWESGIGVKGRNEPRDMMQVLEVVAGLRKMDESVLAEQLYINSCQLFKLMKD